MYYWHWVRQLLSGHHTTGYPTNRDPEVERLSQGLPIPGKEPASPIPILRRASALRHVDGGSCNGCESELSLLSSPDYDFTRYGFSFTPSPKHADLLVVTGVITDAMRPVIQAVYEQMTAPKRVVALGMCAIDGGVFAESPGVIGSLEGILPVTIRVPGCPPAPADILRALLWAVEAEDPVSARNLDAEEPAAARVEGERA